MKSKIHEHKNQIVTTASKKIKWSILSLAVIISVCGAFVTRPHFDCSNMAQYYYAGGVYSHAGTLGVNYVCTSGTGICTYYTLNGQVFYECQAGTYCTSNCIVRPDGQPLKPLKPVTVPSDTQKKSD